MAPLAVVCRRFSSAYPNCCSRIPSRTRQSRAAPRCRPARDLGLPRLPASFVFPGASEPAAEGNHPNRHASECAASSDPFGASHVNRLAKEVASRRSLMLDACVGLGGRPLLLGRRPQVQPGIASIQRHEQDPGDRPCVVRGGREPLSSRDARRSRRERRGLGMTLAGCEGPQGSDGGGPGGAVRTPSPAWDRLELGLTSRREGAGVPVGAAARHPAPEA